MQFEPPANRTPKECTCKLKLLLLSCARWTGLALEMITSLLAKLTLWAAIIKKLFGQLLVRYLIYLTRENQYWAQLTLRPISALLCQINQISDSSRPNNCILLFPNVKIDWKSRGYIIFYIRHAPQLKTQFEPPANRTPKECTCKLKLLLLNCARWPYWFSS